MFIWTLNDVVGLIFFALILIVMIPYYVANLYKEWRCKHNGGVNETIQCDAICRLCHKNLGFIGTWRDNEKARKGQ